MPSILVTLKYYFKGNSKYYNREKLDAVIHRFITF